MSERGGGRPRPSKAPGERDALIAASLDATPELLPVVAAMLEDFDALGWSVAGALSMLDSAGVAPPGLALDLGCGKGTYAVALAQRDWSVRAVDLFPPFAAEARRRAAAAGVGERCRVDEGDLRDALAGTSTGAADLVLLMSVGRPWGGLAPTVEAVRRALRPGGHFLLDDAVLAEGAPAPAGLDGYAPLASTEAELTSKGDRIIARWLPGAAERREQFTRELAHLHARAERIALESPDAAGAARAYLRRQEAAYAELDGPVQPCAWLVRRT